VSKNTNLILRNNNNNEKLIDAGKIEKVGKVFKVDNPLNNNNMHFTIELEIEGKRTVSSIKFKEVAGENFYQTNLGKVV